MQQWLAEEARRGREEVLGQRAELLRLEEALGERLGQRGGPAATEAIDERSPLAALRALAQRLADRAEEVRARIARADALAPMVLEADKLLRGNQATQALATIERVVTEMSEHARAREIQSRARTAVEAERQRQQQATELIQEARAALEGGAPALPGATEARDRDPGVARADPDDGRPSRGGRDGPRR